MDRATDKQIGFLQKHGFKDAWQMSKEDASQKIDEIINKPSQNGKILKEPQLVKTEFQGSKPDYDKKSYYVSYTKDVFTTILQNASVREPKANMDLDMTMDKAIELIQKAKNAF